MWYIFYYCVILDMEGATLLADQPLGQKLIKKGFWLYFFAYLIAPAGYIIRMLISNSLSVEEVGVLYSIISLIGLLNVYNDLGLTESLLYFLPRYWIKKQFNYVKTSIVLGLAVQIFTALLIALVLWFGAPRLGEHYFHNPSAVVILRYFCFYFLGINLFQTLQTIYQSFQDTFSYQFVDFVKTWCVLGFTFFFFITGQASIANYSLNRLLGIVVGIIIGLIIFKKKYMQTLQGKIVLERPMLKEYGKYALWVFIAANAGTLLGSVSQQLIIIILGAEMAGYYANYLSLLTMCNIIVGPILGLIFPLVSECIAKKDSTKLGMLQDFFYTYLILISLSLIGIFTVLGPELAVTLFSKKFLFTGILFGYSSFFILFTVLFSFNFSVLAGLGKIKERVKIIAITAGASIIFNIILLPLIGIWGAIIGLGIGYVIMFIMSYLILQRHKTIHIQRGMITKNVLIVLLLSLSILYFKQSLFILEDIYRYKNFIILILIFGAYYVLFLGFNWKKMILLKDEIQKMRKG